MIEILREHKMALDIETEWIIFENKRFFEYEKSEQRLRSVQILWDGVTGVFNGELIFLLSNDMENSTISKVIMIKSSSNRNDTDMIVFYPCFKYLKIKYRKNGITDGLLSINMSNNY